MSPTDQLIMLRLLVAMDEAAQVMEKIGTPETEEWLRRYGFKDKSHAEEPKALAE